MADLDPLGINQDELDPLGILSKKSMHGATRDFSETPLEFTKRVATTGIKDVAGRVVAIPETAMALSSGLMNMPANLATQVKLVSEGMSREEAKLEADKLSQVTTYQPYTEQGKESTEVLGRVLGLPYELFQRTISPLVGKIAHGIVQNNASAAFKDSPVPLQYEKAANIAGLLGEEGTTLTGGTLLVGAGGKFIRDITRPILYDSINKAYEAARAEKLKVKTEETDKMVKEKLGQTRERTYEGAPVEINSYMEEASIIPKTEAGTDLNKNIGLYDILKDKLGPGEDEVLKSIVEKDPALHTIEDKVFLQDMEKRARGFDLEASAVAAEEPNYMGVREAPKSEFSTERGVRTRTAPLDPLGILPETSNVDMVAEPKSEFPGKLVPAIQIDGKIYPASMPDQTLHSMVYDSLPEGAIKDAKSRPISGWSNKDGSNFRTMSDIVKDIKTTLSGEEGAVGDLGKSKEKSEARDRLAGDVDNLINLAKESGTSLDNYLKEVGFGDEEITKLVGLANTKKESFGIQASIEGVKKASTSLDINSVSGFLSNIRDKFTIESVPKMRRAGVADSAVQHASAKIAVPRMVDDFLAKVFPTRYKDPMFMNKVSDILNKDQILDGYDEFKKKRDNAVKEYYTAKKIAAEALDAESKVKWQKHTRSWGQQAKKWTQKVKDIEDKHNIAALDKEVQDALKDPEVLDSINNYKKFINPEMDKLYNEMKGLDPNTPQDGRGKYTGTRVNLLTAKTAEKYGKQDGADHTPSYSNYRNPNAKADQFDKPASFVDDYSNDMRLGLINSFSNRWNEVTKLRMYKDLINKGVAVDANLENKAFKANTPMPETIQGKKAVRLQVKVPRTSEEGFTQQVEKTIYVREDLVREIRRVLGTDMGAVQNKAARVVTGIQLAQVADAVTHSKNLLSVVTRAQGAGSIWADAARKIPIFGTGDAVVRIAKVAREVLQDTPEIRAEIAEMAKSGLIRPDFPATGINKITHGQQFIHRIDTSAKIIMNRFFDDLAKRDLVDPSIGNRREFINQVGQYNSRLMNETMVWARDKGISPFIVAGRNFNKQGRLALSGNPGVEAASKLAAAKMRLINLSGTVMLFTLPMMLNTLTTGKPMGRSGTPLGAWDTGEDEKERGKHRVVDLLQITGARRGMRSVGLDAALEGIRNKQTLDQVTGTMIKDIGSTALHPWTGPAAGFAVKAVTGKSISLHDFPGAQVIAGGGTAQYVENFRAAVEDINPFIYSMIQPVFKEIGVDTKGEKILGTVGKKIEETTGYHTPAKVADTFLQSFTSSFGVKDAYPGKSAAEKMAMDISSLKYSGLGPMSSEKKEKSDIIDKYSSKFIKALKEGESISSDLISQAKEDYTNGKITDKELKAIDKRIKEMDSIVHLVKPMSFEDALKVYTVANDKEKEELLDVITKKGDKLSKEELTKYMPKIEKAFNLNRVEAVPSRYSIRDQSLSQ